MDNAIFKLTYGLFVLSVQCYKKDNACIINTASQVANSPDRIAISVNKANHTCDMLSYTDTFTLSVISEDADFSLFRRFGFCSGRNTEKFDGFDECVRTENGAYAVTKGTNAYICCTVEEKLDLGSHMLIIAHISDMKVLSDVPSATYAFYHSNIKPQSEKKKSEKTVWRCTVCGYEYEGDDLPDNFICPICKHGAGDFEKV